MSKVIVFSADGMVGEDLALLQTLPNFQRYLASGARITNVSSIYPTVTYPAHATMRTGVYPDVHGVVSNYELLPGVNPPVWAWYNSSLKCADLFDAVKASGRTTASSFWPTTGCHPSIDYLIDECWTEGTVPDPDVFRRCGSSEEVMEIIHRNLHIILNGRENNPPWNEQFCVRCAADMIRKFQPDLLMLHPANLDSYRHRTGVFTDLVRHGVHEIDTWIGELAEACIDAGVWEETNFFLVSDHGLQNINRSVNINTLLKEEGLIREFRDDVLDYDAYCRSNGMSALIYLRDPQDTALRQRVHELLNRWQERGVYGIGRVFTTEETASQYNLDGDFSFVLETDGFTTFTDKIDAPLSGILDNSDYRVGKATHGYLPERGPQPILAANGPDIRQGVVLDGNCIINEAPTFAAIFGLELSGAAGKPISEILK